jgi:hypothetical protein
VPEPSHLAILAEIPYLHEIVPAGRQPPPVDGERQHMDSSGRPEPSYDLAGVDIPDADEPAATSHDGKQVGAAVEGEGQDPVAAHPDRPPETSSAAAVQFPNPGGAGQAADYRLRKTEGLERLRPPVGMPGLRDGHDDPIIGPKALRPRPKPDHRGAANRQHGSALSILHRQAPRQPGYSTLPGFMTPVGSSARLIARITSVASPSSLTK